MSKPEALTGSIVQPLESNSLSAERQAHDLQLREQHVEFDQLGLARAGQVASRNVDDLIGVAEISGAHVIQGRRARLKSAEEVPEESLKGVGQSPFSASPEANR